MWILLAIAATLAVILAALALGIVVCQRRWDWMAEDPAEREDE